MTTGNNDSTHNKSTLSTTATPLPVNPDFDHLRKQAKTLLKAFRAHEAAALQSINAWHPRPQTFTSLRDAQLVVARSYGCNDWQQLHEAVETQLLLAGTLREQSEKFIALACLRYNGDDRAYRYQQAAKLLQTIPAIVGANFYSALVAGNLAGVTALLARQPELATINGGVLNWPPLCYVCYSRVPVDKEQVLAIVALLLSKGASADSHVMLDQYLFSALTGAMGEGERGPIDCPPHLYADELVAMLLAAGANPNDSQGLYNTMFTDSIDKWLPLLVKHGLAAQHIANWAPKDGFTTFDYFLAQAVVQGKLARVELLLQHGANPDAVNIYNKKNSYTNALSVGRSDIADILLKYGARPQKLAADDEFRLACCQSDTLKAKQILQQHPALLHNAQLFHDLGSSVAMVRALVALGFNINCQTHDGRTLLHRYARPGQRDKVEAFIKLGADPHVAEYHWQATALGFAAHDRAWDVVALLVPDSNNILDVCSVVHVERTKFLLEQDASLVHKRTPMGNTPLHVVSQWQAEAPDIVASTAVIELLLSKGADTAATNKEGLNAAQWYRKCGMDELADLLE